jgi:hypothetical protein
MRRFKKLLISIAGIAAVALPASIPVHAAENKTQTAASRSKQADAQESTFHYVQHQLAGTRFGAPKTANRPGVGGISLPDGKVIDVFCSRYEMPRKGNPQPLITFVCLPMDQANQTWHGTR